MLPAEVVQPHREPAHPAVVPARCGKGQGLPDLALVPQATGPIMPFDDTRVNDFVPEEGQDMLQMRLAMHRSHLHPLDPTALVDFLHLSIGQALRPTHHGPRRPAFGAMSCRRVTLSESLQ